MKKILLVILVIVTATITVKAQHAFSKVEFKKNLGKTGTLCDTVYSLHIFSDTLTLLNMGRAYPKQKYNVVIKGNKISLDWASLKGKPLCITGVFLLRKNKPVIEISQPDQINAK
ncbi:MAG: hypothetical protein JWQ63_560 [Mucilaginibacter sp.]|nr:hypothetical protein [Mucilaginibacter sp.]